MAQRIVVFVPESVALKDFAEFLTKVGRAVTGQQAHDDGVDLVFGVDHAAMGTIGSVAQGYGFTVGGRASLAPVVGQDGRGHRPG